MVVDVAKVALVLLAKTGERGCSAHQRPERVALRRHRLPQPDEQPLHREDLLELPVVGFDEDRVLELVDAVAEEAAVALSTIFNYFPGKPDIVFAAFDAVIESARERIVGRPGEEDARSAILGWITEVLPDVELPYTQAIRRMPQIMVSTPELRGEERLRCALLEDALAEGFARDLCEPAAGMRARVMAAIAVGGMIDVWNDWYALHATDAEFDLTELLGLKAAHVAEALAAGLEAIERLPRHTVITAR